MIVGIVIDLVTQVTIFDAQRFEACANARSGYGHKEDLTLRPGEPAGDNLQDFRRNDKATPVYSLGAGEPGDRCSFERV